MEQNSSPHALDKLAAALSKAQAEYKTLTKSKTAKIQTKAGGSYEYAYADLSDMIDATRAALAKNELALVQLIVGDQLVTKLIHSSGQLLESTVRVNLNLSPQEFGSFLTYYRRYTMGPILGIAAEEDDDGAAGQAASKAQSSPPARSSPPPKQNPPAKSDSKFISEAQVKRLYTIARGRGWTDDEIKHYLASGGVKSSREILKSDYDLIVRYFETQAPPGTEDGPEYAGPDAEGNQ